MTYFKAKGYCTIISSNNHSHEFVKDELLTPHEMSLLGIPITCLYNCFKVVKVSRKNTYWLFGARFEIKGDVSR